MLPTIMGLIVGIVVPVMYAWTRTRDSTITGTIKLETYSKDLTDLKDEQKEGFGEINKKLDGMIRKQDLQDYRLDAVENELKDIKEKRISALEKELRELNNFKRRNGGAV